MSGKRILPILVGSYLEGSPRSPRRSRIIFSVTEPTLEEGKRDSAYRPRILGIIPNRTTAQSRVKRMMVIMHDRHREEETIAS